MKRKVIGIMQNSFTPKGEDRLIEGVSIYTTTPIAPTKGEGLEAEKNFLSKARLAGLDFTPKVGQQIEVLYNKFGKVETLRLVSEGGDADEYID